MNLTIQILAVLVALLLLGFGATSMFAPRRVLKIFAIEPEGILGLNTIRSVISGFFLGCVAMIALGLFAGQTLGFVAVAIFVGIVALGRVVGIVADGFDKAVVGPIVVEVVIVVVMLGAYSRLAT